MVEKKQRQKKKREPWISETSFFGKYGTFIRWRYQYDIWTLLYWLGVIKKKESMKEEHEAFLGRYGRVDRWMKYQRARIHTLVRNSWIWVSSRLRVILSELWVACRSTWMIAFDLITLPFYAVYVGYFTLIRFKNWIIRVIYGIPYFLTQIPTFPGRLYHYVVISILDLLLEQSILRKQLFKLRRFRVLRTLLFFYLLLSFVDEIKFHTNHSFAQINEWWTTIYAEGFIWWFAVSIIYLILLILGLYFVQIYYFIHSQKWPLTLIWLCQIDLVWPDITHETIFMISMTLPTLVTYIPICVYCYLINEVVENEQSYQPRLIFSVSWKERYYALRMKEKNIDEHLRTQYKLLHRHFLGKSLLKYYWTWW